MYGSVYALHERMKDTVKHHVCVRFSVALLFFLCSQREQLRPQYNPKDFRAETEKDFRNRGAGLASEQSPHARSCHGGRYTPEE